MSVVLNRKIDCYSERRHRDNLCEIRHQPMLKKIALCLPTKHLRVLENTFKRVRAFQIELEFGNALVSEEGENRSIRRKTSWSKGENQQQTQPIYGVDAGI